MNICMAFEVLLSSGPLLICREHHSQSTVLSNSGRGTGQRQRRSTLARTFIFGRSKFSLDFLSLRGSGSGYNYLIALAGYMQLCEARPGYVSGTFARYFGCNPVLRRLAITTHHSHSIRAQAATLSFAELTHTAAQAITNAAAQEAGKWTSACSVAPPLLFCSII